MTVNDIKEYALIERKELVDLNSDGYLLEHKKSGARVVLISNEDKNKVFYIGFRTPPYDSTGLNHILEHSVLCGSKKFPVKDPFVELAKGSLNTFLNAMTYPDKTVYPVASCNDKDFMNIMDVYLDAVFNTNIYEHKEIFMQEGWHYELKDKNDELKISGVVYNEMKGAFSSPEGVLDREILNSLFPDTSYACESGGNPENIPDLKYEDFLEYHKKYYHPSNSYIYLYGDMDMAEKLLWLDKEYLSKYDKIDIDTRIKKQEGFDKPIEKNLEYSIASGEDTKDNTYLSYNKVIDVDFSKELYYGMDILAYVLLNAPGAPIKQALLDAKIGKDILGSVDEGIIQPIFSVIAKNANIEDKDKFINIIENELKKQVKNGVDKKALLAAVNIYEFKYREADFGNYPKGLMYGLSMFDSWLYDDKKPFVYMEGNEAFKFLREQIGTGYYEKIIEKYILNNNHGSYVTIEPKQGLTAKMDADLAKKLADYKASLTDEQIEELVSITHNLLAYQNEPSTQEELDTIPMLNREDINKNAEELINDVLDIEGVKVLHHNTFTNGIGYLNFCFDISDMPVDNIPYVSLLQNILKYVDTKNYSYNEINNEIFINTGGIYCSVDSHGDAVDFDKNSLLFEVRSSFLYDKLGFATDIIKEIICNTKLDDKKRIYEIISEVKSRLQATFLSAGHAVAITRGMSYFSKHLYYKEMLSGIEFYGFIDDLEKNFDERFDELVLKLRDMIGFVFRKDNLMISYTADDEGFGKLKEHVSDFKAILNDKKVQPAPQNVICEIKNEGFMAASKVQYVARVGNFVKKGYEYTGVLKVLKTMLGYDYLWNNIRGKGGAYGCMNGFGRNGDSFFVSYRDPHLKNTNEIYNNIPEYIRGLDISEKDITKYIIGTISDIDIPKTPKTKGSRSMAAYISNLTFEMIQKERDEILKVTLDDIKKTTEIVEAVLECDMICVVGNEEKLKDNKEMFKELKSLL